MKTKQGCPWSGKKRKKSENRQKPVKEFRADARRSLAPSDQGSWFRQEEQWPNVEKIRPFSASSRKILNVSAVGSREYGKADFIDLFVTNAAVDVTEGEGDEDNINMAPPLENTVI